MLTIVYPHIHTQTHMFQFNFFLPQIDFEKKNLGIFVVSLHINVSIRHENI